MHNLSYNLEHATIKTSNPPVSPKSSRDITLEQRLNLMTTTIKSQISYTMVNLEASGEAHKVDEASMKLIMMINAAEVLQMHFELTLELLKSKSKDEADKAKKKFGLVSKDYDKIASREDLALVPINRVITFLQGKLLDQTKGVLENCFKKSSNGEVKFIKTEENIAKIIILTFNIEMGSEYYPRIVSLNKDDIFYHEKSSPIWQDLYEAATFKEIITKQEVQTCFKQVRLFLHLSFFIVKKYIEDESNSSLRFWTALSLFNDVLYYGIRAAKVETQALLYLTSAKMDHVFKTWIATDHPIVVKVNDLRSPKVGCDQLIFVPRLFPLITRESILKEYQDKTLNKLYPIDPSELKVFDEKMITDMRKEIIEDLFVSTEEKVPIRILAPENLKIRELGTSSGILEVIAKSQSTIGDKEDKQAIIIHIHGGGFVSMSSASHKVYLKRWVKKLKCVLFSIDYRLAPKHKYPAALDDIWQSYLWIINFAHRVLGIKTPKVILTGDSAGGNLVLALTLRLIRAGLEPPTGCFLIYPALLLDEGAVSPSYFQALEDPVLHFSLLKLILKAYIGEEFNAAEDPYLSPLIASDELLKKLPPIRIVSGSEDPLHDDSWRLVARLRKLKKDVKIIVHNYLVHAFLSHRDLKNYELFIEEGCEIMRELAGINEKK